MTAWQPDNDANLVRMRNVDHLSWIKIGNILGWSKTACQRRYVKIVPPDDRIKIRALPVWTEAAKAEVFRLRDENKTFREIAEIVGMSLGQVTGIFERVLLPRRIHFQKESPKLVVPTRILEDRARRYAASHRDLTGAMFGDPLRGYSALERGS